MSEETDERSTADADGGGDVDDGLGVLRRAAAGYTERQAPLWVERLVRGWPGLARAPLAAAAAGLLAVTVAVAVVTAVVVWRFRPDPASRAASTLQPTTPAGGTALDPPDDGTGAGPQGTGAGTGAPAGRSPSPAAPLVVHVTGAVAQPGVYHLDPGARVNDAVDRAGGAAADADLTRVNLAAPLADGGRVYVPRRGEAAPPDVVDGGVSPGDGPPSGPGSTRPARVNINRAGAEELDGLPGIGPSTAAAIVAHRQQRGPFRRVDDLSQVRGIGPAKLEQLRPLVTVS